MYTLAHLHVICRDMEKMIRFWREALGAEFVEYRTFGDDPGAIMRFGGLEIYFKEIPQAKELQSGQVGYEHVGVYVPHLETSVESLVKGFGCTLASMPANFRARTHTSSASVESSPPDTPSTSFCAWVWRRRRARPCA